jgi:lipopolysaccharide transport system ATP-binding protein
MSEILVKVQGVSKRFCKNLKRTMLYGLQDIASSVAGLSVEINGLRPGEFWSVDNVSFELKRGECLGVIGPNGAGKTTLLSLLSGVICPDKGRIEIRGRVGALIQIGAGFHPMLTGRENIYVNGTILGLSKKEIDKKFDEIVAFSELGDFIDTPVKYYSSGMYVRLGFSIATAVKPDILLLDEVLAVGDAGFRTKSLNRVRERVASSAVLFVSHSMSQVARLATKVLVMRSGGGRLYDNPESGINEYLEIVGKVQAIEEWFEGSNRVGTAHIRQIGVSWGEGAGEVAKEVVIEYGEPFRISIQGCFDADFSDLELHIQFVDSEANTVQLFNSALQEEPIRNPGSPFRVNVDFQRMLLFPGKFSLNISVMDMVTQRILARKWNAAPFRVLGSSIGGRYPRVFGQLCVDAV